jgi:hypothetical protein
MKVNSSSFADKESGGSEPRRPARGARVPSKAGINTDHYRSFAMLDRQIAASVRCHKLVRDSSAVREDPVSTTVRIDCAGGSATHRVFGLYLRPALRMEKST